MNFISSYGDDDEPQDKKSIVLAPNVIPSQTVAIRPGSEISFNPKYSELYKPQFGPENPSKKNVDQNLLTGNVQEYNMNAHLFKQEYESKEKSAKLKRKKGVSDPTKKSYEGPWANFEHESTQDDQFDEQFFEDNFTTHEDDLPVKKKVVHDSNVSKIKSILYLKQERDYQGRSWIVPPSDLKPTNSQCYLPKKQLHIYSGHEKGVSCCEFFPKYGHLLLSGSLDASVKIWDVLGDKSVIRDYLGHDKGIKAINFRYDGKTFATGSYDNTVRIWNTETGKSDQSFSFDKIPSVVKIHPDKSSSLLVGCQDKKIYQYDLRSGEISQTYQGHNGPIHSIAFIDKIMVTTADDKALKFWEYGIPVVTKHVSDPKMQSIVSVAIHPAGDFLIAQGVDNHIHVFDIERMKVHKGKKFVGHMISAHSCQTGFSPDGKFVISGDDAGKLWIWDWKTTKVSKTFKLHEGLVQGCQWHPIETSKVVTCGADRNLVLLD